MTAISTMPNSPNGSPSCRCRTSPARCGNTAIPPTSSAAIMEIVSGKSLLRGRAGKAARSARHDRHPLLRHRTGEAEAAGPADAERQQFPGRPRVPRSTFVRSGSPPAAAWSRPWLTSPASRRCCSMAEPSTARRYLNARDVQVDGHGPHRPGLRCRARLFLFPRRRLRLSALALPCAPIPATPSRRRPGRLAN